MPLDTAVGRYCFFKRNNMTGGGETLWCPSILQAYSVLQMNELCGVSQVVDHNQYSEASCILVFFYWLMVDYLLI